MGTVTLLPLAPTVLPKQLRPQTGPSCKATGAPSVSQADRPLFVTSMKTRMAGSRDWSAQDEGGAASHPAVLAHWSCNHTRTYCPDDDLGLTTNVW